MSMMDVIKAKAKQNVRTIVLPEGSEPRTVQAAAIIVKEKIANVILLGKIADIDAVAKEKGVDLTGVTKIDPVEADNFSECVNDFYELRKAKGMTPEEAKKTISDPIYYGTMLLKKGLADGLVSGAIHSTANTLRPSLQIIKTLPGVAIVSSCFIMEVQDKQYGKDGVLLFGDCAINIDPTATDLANIAIATAQTAKNLVGIDPQVAMLSFSTFGSAKHELVDKVVEATKLVKEMAPDLKVDGEMQADAALVESVGQLKAPGSLVAGKANVLIFPDLQAGNIGYKLVQRLGNATAIGPICQGIAKPVNDLSRGCSIDDIVDVVAVTAVQAAAK